jgi:hypothetical protein
MRLRGLSGARDEFHLAAIVQSLRPCSQSSRASTIRKDCVSKGLRATRATQQGLTLPSSHPETSMIEKADFFDSVGQ